MFPVCVNRIDRLADGLLRLEDGLLRLVSVSTSIADTLTRYGKKTDQEVLEPINDVEKGDTTLIWWSGNKFRHLIRCINIHFGLYIYSVFH